MPLVSVKVIKGVLSAKQKKALIKGVTSAMVAVTSENLRQFISVVIEEVKSGEWAIGGQPLTAAEVKAIIAGPVKNE